MAENQLKEGQWVDCEHGAKKEVKQIVVHWMRSADAGILGFFRQCWSGNGRAKRSIDESNSGGKLEPNIGENLLEKSGLDASA